MKIIQLREVLQLMENGQSFSITFIKADRKRNTGGAIETYKNCRLHQSAKPTSNGLARKNNSEKKEPIPTSRNPNHYMHGTRNVELQNGEIRKIHIRLIVKFNGVHVIY